MRRAHDQRDALVHQARVHSMQRNRDAAGSDDGTVEVADRGRDAAGVGADLRACDGDAQPCHLGEQRTQPVWIGDGGRHGVLVTAEIKEATADKYGRGPWWLIAVDRQSGVSTELVKLDARALPFEREFDLVTSAGAFGHFVGADEDALLAGISRALVPGGRFVFLTTPMPKATSPANWMARGFNAVMHVRNALVTPPFIMFYLTFTWPEVKPTLERHGFDVSARDGLLPGRLSKVVAVTATRRG